jgi:hypothetical protein
MQLRTLFLLPLLVFYPTPSIIAADIIPMSDPQQELWLLLEQYNQVADTNDQAQEEQCRRAIVNHIRTHQGVVDPNKLDPIRDRSPFLYVVEHGSFLLLQDFVNAYRQAEKDHQTIKKYSVDFDRTTSQNDTCLHLAVLNKRNPLSIISYFLLTEQWKGKWKYNKDKKNPYDYSLKHNPAVAHFVDFIRYQENPSRQRVAATIPYHTVQSLYGKFDGACIIKFALANCDSATAQRVIEEHPHVPLTPDLLFYTYFSRHEPKTKTIFLQKKGLLLKDIAHPDTKMPFKQMLIPHCLSERKYGLLAFTLQETPELYNDLRRAMESKEFNYHALAHQGLFRSFLHAFEPNQLQKLIAYSKPNRADIKGNVPLYYELENFINHYKELKNRNASSPNSPQEFEGRYAQEIKKLIDKFPYIAPSLVKFNHENTSFFTLCLVHDLYQLAQTVSSSIPDGNENRETELYKKILFGQSITEADIAHYIQNKKADNGTTTPPSTTLHVATISNNTQALQQLIAYDNKLLHTRGLLTGDTPLHTASRIGNVDVAQLLLTHNADPTLTNKERYTFRPVLPKLEARLARYKLIDLEKLQDGNGKIIGCYSPLDIAIETNAPGIVALYVQSGKVGLPAAYCALNRARLRNTTTIGRMLNRYTTDLVSITSQPVCYTRKRKRDQDWPTTIKIPSSIGQLIVARAGNFLPKHPENTGNH